MITNYGELKAEIANYLDREDQADNIPTAIKLAESKIYRRLRTWENEFTQTWTEADSPVSPLDLPQNFREPKLLSVNDKPVEQISAQEFQFRQYEGDDGEVAFYAIIERKLHLMPWPTLVAPTDPVTIELIYYGTESLGEMATWTTPTNPNQVPESDGTPADTTERGDDATTRLLQVAPDAYLYGALVEMHLLLREPAKAMEWKSFFQEAVLDLEMEFATAEFAGSTTSISSIYYDGRP